MYKLPQTLAAITLTLSALLAGCSDNGSSATPAAEGANGEPQITIGAVLPLSGNYASYGDTHRNTFELAEEDAKAEGRPELRLEYGDSKMDKDLAQKEYRRLVDQEGVCAFVEMTGSGCALAVSPVAAQDGIPIVSGINTSPTLTQQGGEFFFRVIGSESHAGLVLCAWAIEEGWEETVLVFNQENDWAVGFKEAITGRFPKKGGSLPESAVFAVTEETVDFSAVITSLKAANPQACFVGLMGRQAGLFSQQAVDKGLTVPLLGVDNFTQQEFIDTAGDALPNSRFVMPTVPTSEKAHSFANRYQERFSREADAIAFKSYDSYFAVLSAIESLVEQRRDVTGTNVKGALDELRFEGLTGVISFDDNGDLEAPAYTRYTFDEEGNRVEL